jgi:hypothetical protein
MKYLDKFFSYVVESNKSGQIDKDYLEDLLISISDLRITYHIKEGTLFGGDYNGRKYLNINLNLGSLKTTKIITTYESNTIDDDRVWELFNEILSLRSRILEEGLENCVISFSNVAHMSFISLTFIGGVDDSGSVKLEELQKRITAILNSMSTDFSYNTYTRLHKSEDDEYIMIISDAFSYTDRKFNNLLRRSLEGSNLSLNDFSIDKSVINQRREYRIKIKLK